MAALLACFCGSADTKALALAFAALMRLPAAAHAPGVSCVGAVDVQLGDEGRTAPHEQGKDER